MSPQMQAHMQRRTIVQMDRSKCNMSIRISDEYEYPVMCMQVYAT